MSNISMDDICAAYERIQQQRHATEIHCNPVLVNSLKAMIEPTNEPDKFGNVLKLGMRIVEVSWIPKDMVITIDQYGEVLHVLVIKEE